MEPFLLRYTYSCDTSTRPRKQHLDIRACTKNLRREYLSHSEKREPVGSYFQSNKTQKHVGLRTRNHILAVSTSVQLYLPQARRPRMCKIHLLKQNLRKPNPQQQRQRLFRVRTACIFTGSTGSTDPK
jgi:hypothetical protein